MLQLQVLLPPLSGERVRGEVKKLKDDKGRMREVMERKTDEISSSQDKDKTNNAQPNSPQSLCVPGIDGRKRYEGRGKGKTNAVGRGERKIKFEWKEKKASPSEKYPSGSKHEQSHNQVAPNPRAPNCFSADMPSKIPAP